MLEDKNIILGVCGGIAAYKACELTSRLRKLGAKVHVIMTKSAAEFVTPLTFQSLSLNRVVTDMFAAPKYWEIEHISLAKLADAFVVAPATADMLGKIANGIADDMLSTTVMATKAPVILAPSMNTNMLENPAVQKNIETLRALGYIFVEPEEGLLACGDVGKGKMAEPGVIEECILHILHPKKDLAGKTVLVTAGPTQEALDPVRYITNHSTGKMGYAIADMAARRGARVILVSGPTGLAAPRGVERHAVRSAREMYEKVVALLPESDIIIKSAAVADYAPAQTSEQKIKKSDDELVLPLKRNPDILYELGKLKGRRILVGFAMETENLIENAQAKLEKKNLDFIVANDLNTEGAGFGTDTNVVRLIGRDGSVDCVSIRSKPEIADIILDKICDIMERT